MDRYLGIDLGTSYFKAGVYSDAGELCGLGREPVPKHTGGGLCELPVEAFWSALGSCVSQALAAAGIGAADICGVSYSSQANSFLLLDGAGEALTPLVLWSDGRAAGGCIPLAELSGRPDFMETTGLGIVPNGEFMVAKTDWFQKTRPDVWRRTTSVMTISDYLVYGMTGRRAGDLTTASMTTLMDVRRGCWWGEALASFGLKAEMLPDPQATGSLAGRITAQGSRLVGLAEGTPVYVGTLDHYAVAIGAGVTAGRCISESTGTVLACVRYTEGYIPRKGVITSPGLDAGHYFQLAFSGNGATAVEWYQKNYAPDKTIAQLEEAARKVPAGCDGLTALPQSDGYPGLSGFVNVRPEHTPAHFLRAIFESTAASLKELVDTLDPEKEVAGLIPSGGGARNPLWLEIKSALLGREYFPQPTGELATKGAAMICKQQNA